MLKRLMVLFFAVPLATGACVSSGTTRAARTAGTADELPGHDQLGVYAPGGGDGTAAPKLTHAN